MRRLRAALVRLLGAVRLMRSDAEIAEELRSHVEMLARRRIMALELRQGLLIAVIGLAVAGAGEVRFGE